jgi:transcriptional regulator with XRE-family HTH domain
MALYKRIRDLREDSDKTQIEIADYLGTTAQYYGKYEKGERELPFSRAIQLADYYHVSLDYLAERCDEPRDKTIRSDELKHITNWRRLSEKNRNVLEYLTEMLIESQRGVKKSE